ncbi:histone deacetylase complex subunit SAP130 [Sitophilus oryzae]|uniref:Histone deacetylase complex subunit SAP130 n=1 Tax=Sitophilus oryzae TaxID=7048 RepID=A0A6J2XI62_SITOR|nr:histone deacetylase complex subunit SAP130 [Sitophilus oryzae]
MSGNGEDEKEVPKVLPLDLARTQIAAVRAGDGNKAPLVVPSQALRNMRVLTQSVSTNSNSAAVGQAIITNLVPQAIINQVDPSKTQITNIGGPSQGQAQTQVTGTLAIQRSAQITLSTAPVVAQNTAGTSYHVPRGPAVVANLAAPRSNVATVRAPLIVTAQNSQAFVRPPRTPSPAPGTAWLTNTSNGSQKKGASTVLSSPVRGATVTGKPQVVGRPQGTAQSVIPNLKAGTIIQSGIIGQTIHSFKPASGTIQTLGAPVTLAQMLPARTQAVVFSANTVGQFTPTGRITVTTAAAQNQVRPPQTRPLGPVVTGTRLAVPISQVQAQTSRILTPQQSGGGSLTVTPRIGQQSQPQPVLATTRIGTTQATANVVGRLSVTPSTISGSVTNVSNIPTTQARISTLSTLNLQSFMVANGGHARMQTTQGPKVITQPAQATIHLTQISPQIKTSAAVVSTGARTINVPASIVPQRTNSIAPSQAISIAKVFPASEGQGGTTTVFVPTPLQTTTAQRRTSPSPVTGSSNVPQTVMTATTVASYSLTGQEGSPFFYDTTGTPAGTFQRAFVSGQQVTGAFAAQPQQQNNTSRPLGAPITNQQLHGIGMRFNSVMVVEQSGAAQTTHFQPVSAQAVTEHLEISHSQPSQSKVTSSPRPSILRKRDHEGSPLKAAKNLTPALQNLAQHAAAQVPASPSPPPRPDSRGNGHSSGGSTTISATSSPGLPEVNEDSNPAVTMNLKEEEDEETKPPMEMSPRKKPRKQQLTGNEIEENHDDMQFISDTGKKETYDSDGPQSDGGPKDGAPEAVRVTTLRKPATASLLNGYRQTWKATHNHYQRYSDVKPKDERRPTIMDLANQNKVTEKINGWKIHHLSTQMEDLAEQEQTVYDQLTELLKVTESEENSKQIDKEVNRVNELIKGNLQRIKIINDGMLEAKCQIMKIFDHQRHVNDIVNRCASKRNFKKREKI